MIYSISFSIPEEKIVKSICHKKKIFATIIPGDLKTYIFDNEKDYYYDYQISCFGYTKKKAGWDCLRHYEILANGCIPLFENIDNIPEKVMIHFPKKELKNIMEFFENNPYCIDGNDPYLLEKQDLWKESYYILANELLEYTKNNLTTKKMAIYILENVLKEKIENIDLNNMKVLFLSGITNYALSLDYLRCLTLHGFKDLLKDNCHDYPCIEHLYKDYNLPLENLYGKGMSCTKLLERNTNRNEENDKTIIEDIKNHKYNLIIYGSFHRGIPYFDLVNEYYQKNEIILLCGEDEPHICNCKNTPANEYQLFIRENI